MGFWADITGQTAASEAAAASTAASEAAIAEQQRQFDVYQEALSPYQQAGETALQSQMALSGALGSDAQAQAYSDIQNSEAFQNALSTGETSMLQSASATGGLRGGDTQGALATYAPSLLSDYINNQYSQLSGLSTMGANAASGVGSAALSTGSNVSSLLSDIGTTQANSALSSYQLGKGFVSDIAGLGLGIAGLF